MNMTSPEALTSEFVNWCKHERDRLRYQREILASGACRMGYNFGSGWVDSTSETLSQLDATLAELDRIVGNPPSRM
jgi:hypothetical protein